MSESRFDRLARIKRALEMGMPPLSTEDQLWLIAFGYHTLAPPRKRCETCGGAGGRHGLHGEPTWIACEECGGSGFKKE
jgi:hypothetical protein